MEFGSQRAYVPRRRIGDDNGAVLPKMARGSRPFPGKPRVPTADEVNIYANSMQRTIATAQYFASGFTPMANLTVNHRFSPSKMDPVFCPQLTKVSPEFQAEAMKQIAATWAERKGLLASTRPLSLSMS